MSHCESSSINRIEHLLKYYKLRSVLKTQVLKDRSGLVSCKLVKKNSKNSI